MKNILESINSPNDLKMLDDSGLKQLADEIRNFLIDNILVTGGHLASNLGVVELTIALHKVFDFSRDRIIFDVGHQSYVHKIITGRREKFSTLRTLGGLSGFPKPSESYYDAFATGHASTSISAAAGYARARDLCSDNYNVIAFIGDGALTGGMTFEALNDIGQRKSKMIIVLNDNEMSIEKNVGGLSSYLSKFHYNKKYMKTKSAVSDFLDKQGNLGKNISNFLKTAKDKFKFATVAAPYFESIGIKYIGIIDGNNINDLIDTFEKVKDTDEPVIIHTFTKKGLGYKEAEENPSKYHGISRHTLSISRDEIKYSQTAGSILLNLAMNNDKMAVVTAAMTSGCGLTDFSKTYPERFFDVGIAEEHAVTMAAGMASGGIIPVVCIYSTFLQRAYDQIIHDVCMQNLHVVFAIDRAGIVGEDGETHQGLFDLSYLTHIPNMTVLSPSCYSEMSDMFNYAINKCNTPVAIRYPKGCISFRNAPPFEISKAERISYGKISLITCGNMVDTALKVSEILRTKGIECGILNLRTIKPVDESAVYQYCTNKAVFTLEDNTVEGGMGAYIEKYAAESGCMCVRLGFPDKFITHGKQSELMDMYSLTPQKIAYIIERKLTGNES